MIGSIKKWISTHWFAIFLFVFSAGLRFYAYNKSSFANGWDSYFYIIQIKSFLEEGAMHSSRYSLFYPVLLFFQFITNDYEFTYKVTSAFIVGSFSAAFYKLSAALSKGGKMAYILGAYTLFSPHLTYFGSQYVKNLMGITLFLILVICLLRSRYIISLVLLIANLFIHKMTAGLSVVIMVFQLVFKRLSKTLLWKVFLFGSLLFITFLVLPNLISLEELNNRGMNLAEKPHWPTYSFIQSFDGVLSDLWYLDLIIANITYLGVSGYLLYKRSMDANWLSLITILTILTFPFLEWSVLGLSFRFFMAFVLLCPLLLSIISIKIDSKYLFGIVSIIVLYSLYSVSIFSLKKFDPPYSLYKHISQGIVAQSSKHGYHYELIIAHKSLAEYITFSSGIDVLPWEPEYEIATDKLWRIATGLNSKSISYFSGIEFKEQSVHFLSANYFLIRGRSLASDAKEYTARR